MHLFPTPARQNSEVQVMEDNIPLLETAASWELTVRKDTVVMSSHVITHTGQ